MPSRPSRRRGLRGTSPTSSAAALPTTFRPQGPTQGSGVTRVTQGPRPPPPSRQVAEPSGQPSPWPPPPSRASCSRDRRRPPVPSLRRRRDGRSLRRLSAAGAAGRVAPPTALGMGDLGWGRCGGARAQAADQGRLVAMSGLLLVFWCPHLLLIFALSRRPQTKVDFSVNNLCVRKVRRGAARGARSGLARTRFSRVCWGWPQAAARRRDCPRVCASRACAALVIIILE